MKAIMLQSLTAIGAFSGCITALWAQGNYHILKLNTSFECRKLQFESISFCILFDIFQGTTSERQE